jgi:hypothetical protein
MYRTLHHHNGTTRQVHLAGWKKQFSDPRDEEFSLKIPHGFLSSAITTADNRKICSTPVDQLNLGSCTANAFTGLVESNELRRLSMMDGVVVSPTGTAPSVTVSGISVATDGTISYTTAVKAAAPTPPAPPAPTPPTPPTPPAPPAKLVRGSRLFQYYVTRSLEGTTSEDSGATIRDAIKAAVQYGVVDEDLYPYDVNKFAIKPGSSIYTTAASHKVTSYHSIADGDINTMKAVLSGPIPFLIEFGFTVYDYMLSAEMSKLGMLHMPTSLESVQGGHAVDLVGFDDRMQIPGAPIGAFLVRNSWGQDWGIGGYFWMPYAYVGNTRLASDFWIVQSAPI